MGMDSSIIGGGLSLLGSVLGGDSARDAAQTSANAQLEASRMAAEEARFRPLNVIQRDNRFSIQPTYTYDPSGRVTGVEAGLTPEMQAYQDRILALTGRGLTQAEQAGQQYAPLTGAATSLFNLGEKYLAETPEQVAQKYMTSQYDLLDPSRQRQLANIRNQNFQTGRGGLSVGSTGLRPSGAEGLRGTNPELEAYYNALQQQDALLAAQAQEAGQRQTAFGTGLFGAGSNLLNQYQTGQVGALSPFSTGLGLASTVNQFAYEPVRLGAELGGRAMQGGAQAGQSLLLGGLNAARTMQPANALDPFSRTLSNLGENRQFTSGLGKLFSPYVNAQQAMGQYGAGNVYGFGGQGTVPTEYTSFDY